jgi:hypothetical protein
LIHEGTKVRIIGAKKTHVTKTDQHGVFEIYDLPAGRYLVEPEIPAGWKTDLSWLRNSAMFCLYQRLPRSGGKLTSVRRNDLPQSAHSHTGSSSLTTQPPKTTFPSSASLISSSEKLGYPYRILAILFEPHSEQVLGFRVRFIFSAGLD